MGIFLMRHLSTLLKKSPTGSDKEERQSGYVSDCYNDVNIDSAYSNFDASTIRACGTIAEKLKSSYDDQDYIGISDIVDIARESVSDTEEDDMVIKDVIEIWGWITS